MGRLHIRQLDIEGGFRSLVGPISIKFPSHGLVLLKGVNLDTGGTSAAGKSSILHAISYGFECCPFPANTHQSWFCDVPYEVTLHLDTQEGPAVLVRGQKPSIKVGDEKKITSATGVQARLRALTGYSDPKMLAALTYREQREHGLFLNKTDGEKKEFLTALIPVLGKFEEEAEAAQKKVSSLEAGAAALQAELDRVKRELAETPMPPPPDLVEQDDTAAVAARKAVKDHATKISGLDMRWRVVSEEERQLAIAAKMPFDRRVGDLDAQIRGLRSIVQNFQPDPTEANKTADLTQECGRRLAAAKAADRDREREVQRQKSDLNNELRDIQGRLGRLLLTRKAQEALQREIDQLQGQTCPTCERPWEQAAGGLAERVARMAELEAELAQEPVLRARFDELPALRDACVFTPDPKVAALEQAHAKLSAKLAALNAQLDTAIALHTAEVNAQVSALNQERSEVMAQGSRAYDAIVGDPERESAGILAQKAALDAQLPGMKALADSLERELQQVARANQQAIDNWKLRSGLHQKCKAAVELAEDKSAGTLTQYAEARDWLGLIKSFIGSIFDEVLADISHETNRILAKLPNTAHCLLHFRSEVETQGKKLVKKIVPVVTIRGVEAPYKSGCSGGMISVVELAVDLAVAKVVQRRTGCTPGWLILDESFEGLGRVEKESCMEMLREYAEDRLIIVVDHASEFKEMFTQTITVEHENGISRVL